MNISKAEFIDWKAGLVTEAFFEAAQERVEDTKELLAASAGLNPEQDSFLRGFIAAYREIRNFSVEED
jgi:hypothetical protein